MDTASVHKNVAAVADSWSAELGPRLRRQALDKGDFATLRDAGLTLTGVPGDMGGVWHGPERSTRPVGAIFRTLAQVDPSVALVATMHTTVLNFWLEEPAEPSMATDAWRDQRDRVLSAAKSGHWFGTISSEPGGGGDLMATRAIAQRDHEGVWRVTGEKHMGSGSGVTSFMITIAMPEGDKAPDIFLLDTRELPGDGSGGATLVREWDGHGMAATQSHAFQFDHVVVERHAQLGGALKLIPKSRRLLLTCSPQ